MKNKLMIFNSTSEVIMAEGILKRAKFQIRTIPIPKNHSSNCGVGIKYSLLDEEAILEILNEKKLKYSKLIELDF